MVYQLVKFVPVMVKQQTVQVLGLGMETLGQVTMLVHGIR
jgi:hypothetical protein